MKEAGGTKEQRKTPQIENEKNAISNSYSQCSAEQFSSWVIKTGLYSVASSLGRKKEYGSHAPETTEKDKEMRKLRNLTL